MALRAKKIRYTFADCLTWDEEEQIELINGEVFMMAPPSSTHQRIAAALTAQLYNYLKGKTCEVFPAPFGVRLFEQDEDRPEDVTTMVEPDISVICDKNKIDEHGCKGAPDLVIEILSPSTSRRDRLVKFNLYEQAGVREYWIVEPEIRAVQVHTLEDGHYHAAQLFNSTVKVGVLEDCVIDLKDVFPK